MPKQKADIPNFGSGLFVSHRDPQVPDNAITGNSLNIDITRDGYIQMARQPKAVPLSPGFTDPVKWIHRFKIENDPELLIYGTGEDKGFHVYKDKDTEATEMPGGKISGSDGYDVEESKIVASASNLALHLGVGNGSENSPLWIGKYKHTQFGIDPDEDYHIEKAECLPPNVIQDAFSNIHKVVKCEYGYLGIGSNDNYVRKFTNEGFVENGDDFSKLTAICVDKEDPRFAYVYEEDFNEVHRIDSKDMRTTATAAVNTTLITEPDCRITDMAVGDNVIWMIAINTLTFEVQSISDFIWSIDRFVLSESKATTNHSFGLITKTPNALVDDNGLTYFIIRDLISDVGQSDAEAMWESKISIYQDGSFTMKVSPICLVQTEETGIGICFVPFYNGQYDLNNDDPDLGDYTTNIVDKRGFFIDSNFDKFADTAVACLKKDRSHRVGGSGSGLLNRFVRPIDTIEWYYGETFPSSVPSSIGLGSHELPTTTIQEIPGTPVYIHFAFHRIDTQDEPIAIRRLEKSLLETDPNNMIGDIQEGTDFEQIATYEFNKDSLRYLKDDNSVFFWTSDEDKPAMLDENTNIISESTKTIRLETIPNGFTNIEDATTLFYRVSFLYDGISESALSERSVIDISENDKGIQIKVAISESLSRRVSHLNIYRASSLGPGAEQGYYRRVVTIDMSEPWPLEHGFYDINYNDRVAPALLGPTYESSSGLPENLRHTLPHYNLSVMLNDRLYIADCWHPDIDDARLFLFRSHRYAVDVFNWPENVLRLPATPIAITEMAGRIFVFDRSDCHIVNPESMYIERTIRGAGAINHNSVIKTPDGIFVGSHHHAYQFTGDGRNVISTPVEPQPDDSDTLNWKKLAEGNNFHGVYHHEKREIIFISSWGSPSIDTWALSWNIPNQYWKAFKWDTTNTTAVTSTYHGQVIASDQNHLRWLFAGSEGIATTADIYTKTFDFNDANNHKWVYALKIEATTGVFTVTMYNQSANHSLSVAKADIGDGFYNLPIIADEQKLRTVRFKINFDDTVKIYKASITYRTKVIYAGQDV